MIRSAIVFAALALSGCDSAENLAPAAPTTTPSAASTGVSAAPSAATPSATPPPPAAPQPATTTSDRFAQDFRALGTEPFWALRLAGNTLTYSTPEDQAGTRIAVSRTRTAAGLTAAGTYSGKPFRLEITAGKCSDGMSDRVYGHTAALQVAGERRQGCADPAAGFDKGERG